MLWNTPKISKDGCKQMLYIDATGVYMQRERDRRGRCSPACLSAARLSAGWVKDDNNRITAGAVQLEQLGTGRLPVQIPHTSFWKLAVNSAVSTWARHLTLAGYASHTFFFFKPFSPFIWTDKDWTCCLDEVEFCCFSHIKEKCLSSKHPIWAELSQEDRELRCGPECTAGAACDLD